MPYAPRPQRFTMLMAASLFAVLAQACGSSEEGTTTPGPEDTGAADTGTAPVDGSTDTGTPEDTGSAPTDTGSTPTDTGVKTDTAVSGDTGSATDTATAGDTCVATTITALATTSTTNIWIGQSGAVDASTSTIAPAGGALTYAWTFTSKPSGSGIALAATTAAANFVADKAGDYVAEVTVSGPCAAPKTASVTVHAFDAPVFYESLDDIAANKGGLTLRIAGAVETAPVSGSTLLPAHINSAATFDTQTYSDHASFGFDVWEPPTPGTPSRAVFSWYKEPTTGPNTSPRVMYKATSDSRDSPVNLRPTILIDSLTDSSATAAQGQTMALVHPRFSPNGNRVAYIKLPHGGYANTKVSTVGFDGTGGREINAFFKAGQVPADGAVNANNIARPQWVANDVLAWVRKTAAANWEIVTASDVGSSTPSTLFTCAGPLPKMFHVLPNNEVLIAEGRPDNDTSTPSDVKIYKPFSAGGTCTLVRNLTNLPQKYRATDFIVSPDGTKVIYMIKAVVASGAALDNRLMTVNIDGTGAPAQIGTITTTNNAGARYVAGGARLALTINGSPATVPLSGTPVRTLQTATTGTTLSTAGNGGGCNVGGRPETLGIVALAYAVGMFIRSRRKDESPS